MEEVQACRLVRAHTEGAWVIFSKVAHQPGRSHSFLTTKVRVYLERLCSECELHPLFRSGVAL